MNEEGVAPLIRIGFLRHTRVCPPGTRSQVRPGCLNDNMTVSQNPSVLRQRFFDYFRAKNFKVSDVRYSPTCTLNIHLPSH